MKKILLITFMSMLLCGCTVSEKETKYPVEHLKNGQYLYYTKGILIREKKIIEHFSNEGYRIVAMNKGYGTGLVLLMEKE